MRVASSPSAGDTVPLRRDPNYRKLWLAHTVSQLGTQLSFFAFPFIAVELLDATPLQLGILTSIQFAPFVLLGLPVGVLVDRFPRRPLLVAADFTRVALLALAALALAGDWLTLGLLYAFSVAIGSVSIVFDIASQSILPELVRRHRLVDANTGLEISRSAAQIGGAGLAGAIVQWLGATVAVALDALSYVVSGTFLAWLRLPTEPVAKAPAARSGWWREAAAGLGFVFRHTVLRWLAIASGLANLGVAAMEALLVLFALRILDISAGQLGIVFAAGNVGILAGSFVTAWLTRRMREGAVLTLAAVAKAVGVLLVPLASLGAPVVVLAAGQLLRTLGVVMWNIIGVTVRQVVTPDAMLGKVNATMRVAAWSGLPVGGLLGGAIAGEIGVRPTLFVAAAVAFAAAALILTSRVGAYRLEHVPEP